MSGAEPYVLSMEPAGGPATGGTSVTLTGIEFGAVTQVRFGARVAEPSGYLRTDGKVTGLLLHTPAYDPVLEDSDAGGKFFRADRIDHLEHSLWKGGAPTVPVRVSADGERWFGGDFRANRFIYYTAQPYFLEPHYGPPAGGTAVTVYGGGFDQYPGAQWEATCKFGMEVRKAFQIAKNHMVCMSPAYVAQPGAAAGSPWALLQISLNGRDYALGRDLHLHIGDVSGDGAAKGELLVGQPPDPTVYTCDRHELWRMLLRDDLADPTWRQTVRKAFADPGPLAWDLLAAAAAGEAPPDAPAAEAMAAPPRVSIPRANNATPSGMGEAAAGRVARAVEEAAAAVGEVAWLADGARPPAAHNGSSGAAAGLQPPPIVTRLAAAAREPPERRAAAAGGGGAAEGAAAEGAAAERTAAGAAAEAWWRGDGEGAAGADPFDTVGGVDAAALLSGPGVPPAALLELGAELRQVDPAPLDPNMTTDVHGVPVPAEWVKWGHDVTDKARRTFGGDVLDTKKQVDMTHELFHTEVPTAQINARKRLLARCAPLPFMAGPRFLSFEYRQSGAAAAAARPLGNAGPTHAISFDSVVDRKAALDAAARERHAEAKAGAAGGALGALGLLAQPAPPAEPAAAAAAAAASSSSSAAAAAAAAAVGVQPPPSLGRALLPFVYLPGMLVQCKNVEMMLHAADLLRYAGVPTFCLEGFVREPAMDDAAIEASTFTTPLREQAARLRAQILAMPALERGFHLAGFSQGGLLARLYTQLFNPLPPTTACASGACGRSARPFRVVSLFSFHSPQAGISQVPSTVAALLTVPVGGPGKIYTDEAQQAATWLSFSKDCTRLADYRSHSLLAEFNNERTVKFPLYAERLRQLRAFVLMGSSVDATIFPPESQMFGFLPCDADGYGDADDVAARASNGAAAPDAAEAALRDLSKATAAAAEGGELLEPVLSFSAAQEGGGGGEQTEAGAVLTGRALLPLGALASGYPLRRSRSYREDWLGLRSLDERGRLHFFEDGLTHKYAMEPSQCTFRLMDRLLPFLNVTIEEIEAEEEAERKLNARGRARQRAATQARKAAAGA